MVNIRKIMSLLLVVAIVCSLCVPVLATEMPVDEPENDGYSTEVTYNGEADNDGDGQPDAQEAYTVAVPAQLAPGDSGTVTLSGTWASNRMVTVTASESIDMVNSINKNDIKELDVTFDEIKLAGSNTSAVSQSKNIAVEKITNALFGTWEGLIQYQVRIETTGSVLEGDGQTFHKMAPSTLSFRSHEPLSEFKEVQINGVTVDPAHYTLKEGSTIVTLSIDYLNSLDVDTHEITIVSENSSSSAGFEIIEPELNEYGFYYNQPYSAWVEAFGVTAAFLLKDNGIVNLIFLDDTIRVGMGTFTIIDNDLTISSEHVGTFHFNITSDKTQLYCTDLDTMFILDKTSIVVDDDYVYGYSESLKGYSVTTLNKNKSSYAPIKSNINGYPIVHLASYMFENNDNLFELPKFPEKWMLNINNTGYAWGEGMFEGCGNLTSVIIPDCFPALPYCCFKSCKSLTSVVIPNTITAAGSEVFAYCTSLTDISFLGTVEQWNSIQFDDSCWLEIPATEVICSDGVVPIK